MTTLQKPKHIVSLATSCILVSADIHIWTATKADGKRSKEITDNNNADSRAATVTQHLIVDNPLHKELINYRQTVYNWMDGLTFPWAGSQNLLPVISLPNFMVGWQRHEAEFGNRKDRFMAGYEDTVKDAASKRGNMFNINDYPTPADVQDKFYIKLYTSEVPQGDFRVVQSYELAEDLQHTFERQATDKINEIAMKQSAELAGIIRNIADSCSLEEEHTDKGVKIRRKKIYESVLDRAKDLCRVYKEFNPTGNPDLEAAREEFETVLTGINLDSLRDSDLLRVRTKDQLEEILGKFKV